MFRPPPNCVFWRIPFQMGTFQGACLFLCASLNASTHIVIVPACEKPLNGPGRLQDVCALQAVGWPDGGRAEQQLRGAVTEGKRAATKRADAKHQAGLWGPSHPVSHEAMKKKTLFIGALCCASSLNDFSEFSERPHTGIRWSLGVFVKLLSSGFPF